MNYSIVKTSSEDFGEQAARVFLDKLSDASRTAIPPSVTLPTGNTPLPFYQVLRERGPIPPFVFCQLDEYAGLDVDDPRLFSQWLAGEILDPLKVRVRMTFNTAAQNPALECSRVEEIHTLKPLDIAVLGLGKDGHVGFNMPGTSSNQGVHRTKLSDETIEQNNAYWNDEGRKPLSEAYTLGIANLKESKQTILLVRGKEKSGILNRAFQGEITPQVPATYLQTQPKVTIVADDAALSCWTGKSPS